MKDRHPDFCRCGGHYVGGTCCNCRRPHQPERMVEVDFIMIPDDVVRDIEQDAENDVLHSITTKGL